MINGINQWKWIHYLAINTVCQEAAHSSSVKFTLRHSALTTPFFLKLVLVSLRSITILSWAPKDYSVILLSILLVKIYFLHLSNLNIIFTHNSQSINIHICYSIQFYVAQQALLNYRWYVFLDFIECKENIKINKSKVNVIIIND